MKSKMLIILMLVGIMALVSSALAVAYINGDGANSHSITESMHSDSHHEEGHHEESHNMTEMMGEEQHDTTMREDHHNATIHGEHHNTTMHGEDHHEEPRQGCH